MSSAASIVRGAREDAGLTQRALALASGVPQASIARIEAGRIDPRSATLGRLLAACGRRLATEVVVESGERSGVDRSVIRELLTLTPTERHRRAVADAHALTWLLQAQPARQPAPSRPEP
jgi:transcriptional regulator with XRE-family HTH domain